MAAAGRLSQTQEPLTLATLVLSTVGNVLGGPVGGAIGALIGQSFDRQLLAPARRGPRLGDLAVQSSSYGTQIPRIYGTMRVAGSVIWSTDLVESSEAGGAKGQPDVAFNYSVSMAVALSSRRVSAIGRIWADGKLLRGEQGDFKVDTEFRFYGGDEDQIIDPLIGSIEGIPNTPGYRGLAVTVFENLQLAEFGNRIPFLTFEVVADEDPPAISDILADTSRGIVLADASDIIAGYAAYGASTRAAVEPLVNCFDVQLFDDGTTLRTATAVPPLSISTDELGNSADDKAAPRMQREQLPPASAPGTLELSYYDPQRDYQSGEARASTGERNGTELQQDLPAVLDAPAAKGVAQQMLARRWAARDKLTLRLPPSRMALEPGKLVDVPADPLSWVVDSCTVDAFVTVAELRPIRRPALPIDADPGRIINNPDVVAGPLDLALIDVPDVSQSASDQPAILIAASNSTAGWKLHAMTITAGGLTLPTQTAARKSVLGSALTALGPADAYLRDDVNGVEIQLDDADQWLTSCDDEGLAAGTNMAVLGREVIQFGDAEPLGGGRFRLRRLLRGRGATEWAAAAHVAGEVFCLLRSDSVRQLILPPASLNSAVSATARDGSSASIQFAGESLKPFSPINLSAFIDASGDLQLSWTRRSRMGLIWMDEVDAPIGETREQYRVTVMGSSGTAEFTCNVPQLTIAGSALAIVGEGNATIEVRQTGDWAASRPVQSSIILS
jgi:hypothetical protein